MMVTGAHGVRMQYNYTQDLAGLPGTVSAAAPRWLRLTRADDTITGYDSVDGIHWTPVGTATLPGLPSTVQAGLFAASPADVQVTSRSLGGTSGSVGPSQATGDLRPHRPAGPLAGRRVERRGHRRGRRVPAAAGRVSPGRRRLQGDRIR